MAKEVNLRQAGGCVSAINPKDMADRHRLEAGDQISLTDISVAVWIGSDTLVGSEGTLLGIEFQEPLSNQWLRSCADFGTRRAVQNSQQ